MYCDNNPIYCYDPTGESATEVLGGWTGGMWWLLGVDGPVPVGDIIYVVGVIGLGAWAIVESYSSASDERIIDTEMFIQVGQNREEESPRILIFQYFHKRRGVF